MNKQLRIVSEAAALALLVLLGCFLALTTTTGHSSAGAAQDSIRLAQDTSVSVVPEALERISWSAVLAGVALAITIEIGLNLLGVAIGALAFDADDGVGEIKTIGIGTIVWMAVSMLIAYLAGGWLAARFAGQPDETDAMLHGLLVWSVAMLLSLVLLMTAVGRFMGSVGSILSGILRVTGRAAQSAVSTGADVVQGAAQAASGAVKGAAERVDGDSPELAAARDRVKEAWETIQSQAMEALRTVGISPEGARSEARQAAGEVRAAAQQAAQDPRLAQQQLQQVVSRLVQRGQGMATQADRQAVVEVLMNNAGMDRARAEQTVQGWEESYNRAAQEVERLQSQTRQRAEQAVQSAQNQVQRVRARAEETARDAANATASAIAGMAGALFIVMVIGAAAAGIGGYVGAPDELPTVEIDEAGL